MNEKRGSAYRNGSKLRLNKRSFRHFFKWPSYQASLKDFRLPIFLISVMRLIGAAVGGNGLIRKKIFNRISRLTMLDSIPKRTLLNRKAETLRKCSRK